MLANVNGIRLYYEAHGAGQPVVLVHGLGLSSDMWHYQVPALAEQYRVITIDTRGFGQTSKPRGPYEMEMYVEDLLQLLDFLGFGSAVLIGLSMGGGIVQSFALAHPDRVLALGLISTGSDHTDASRATFFSHADTVEREGMSPFIESVVPKYFAPDSLRDKASEVARILQTELANDPSAWAAGARVNGTRNWTQQLVPNQLSSACISAARSIHRRRGGLRRTRDIFPMLRCTFSLESHIYCRSKFRRKLMNCCFGF